jgi:hypothetical protein
MDRGVTDPVNKNMPALQQQAGTRSASKAISAIPHLPPRRRARERPLAPPIFLFFLFVCMRSGTETRRDLPSIPSPASTPAAGAAHSTRLTSDQRLVTSDYPHSNHRPTGQHQDLQSRIPATLRPRLASISSGRPFTTTITTDNNNNNTRTAFYPCLATSSTWYAPSRPSSPRWTSRCVLVLCVALQLF